MENGQAQADRLQRASKAPFFGAHNLIHGLKALIPCWAWVSRGRGFENREKMMNEGQEKSPFSDSLETEENGLGFENLNQRLQRYAGAKSRALDMADYIKTEEVSNNENRKLVKNWAIVHRISYSNITTPKTK